MTTALELTTSVGVARAAEVFDLPRASVYRARQPQPAREPGPRPAPPRALKLEERQAVLEVLHRERFVDVAPKEVFATLLDERVYLCSWRTM
jgi:putative transposase